MTITFTAMNGADHDDLVSFLQINTFPYHAGPASNVESIRRRVHSGRFWNDESQAFWINDGDTRLGLVVLEDLHDDTPVFDLRLANVHRGKGLRVPVLESLCDHAFTTMAGILRFEGQFRENDFAMGKTFLRAGFIKEAHYRQAWPDAGGEPLAAVAYAVLRSDWESGITTSLDWDDFTLQCRIQSWVPGVGAVQEFKDRELEPTSAQALGGTGPSGTSGVANALARRFFNHFGQAGR